MFLQPAFSVLKQNNEWQQTIMNGEGAAEWLVIRPSTAGHDNTGNILLHYLGRNKQTGRKQKDFSEDDWLPISGKSMQFTLRLFHDLQSQHSCKSCDLIPIQGTFKTLAKRRISTGSSIIDRILDKFPSFRMSFSVRGPSINCYHNCI